MALVGTAQAVAVRTIGAESEPERGFARALMDVGLDVQPASLAVGGNPVETVREQLRAVGAEDHDGRKERAVGQSLDVLIDDIVVDTRADLSACIGHETVQREDLAEDSGR